MSRRPLALLGAVNALNLADVFLTRVSLGAGAEEANPFASRFGMGWKLVIVAVASWGLFRIRPRALLVPLLALGLAVAYEIAALAVYT